MKPTDTFRMGGIIGALALALLLSACSAIKLGYNTLPELAYFWLDGYADFDDAQETQVRQELVRLHAWHRRQELPRVAEVLNRIELLAPGEITPQQACAVIADFQAGLARVADAAEPGAAAIAVTMTSQQLRHMDRKFRRANAKFREESVDPPPEKRQEKRYEQLLDRMEMIYGRLEEPQRAILRQGVAQSTYDGARILADRQRRQQELLQVLRRAHQGNLPETEVRTQLRAWLERAQRSPDPEYRAWQEGLVQEGCRIFAAVHRATTPAQREQAVRRLRAYQRDLRDLAAPA